MSLSVAYSQEFADVIKLTFRWRHCTELYRPREIVSEKDVIMLRSTGLED
jgi:hypothetical protein